MTCRESHLSLEKECLVMPHNEQKPKQLSRSESIRPFASAISILSMANPCYPDQKTLHLEWSMKYDKILFGKLFSLLLFCCSPILTRFGF
jgi:hypothetical protein